MLHPWLAASSWKEFYEHLNWIHLE